jgi:hypothetical protein
MAKITPEEADVLDMAHRIFAVICLLMFAGLTVLPLIYGGRWFLDIFGGWR